MSNDASCLLIVDPDEAFSAALAEEASRVGVRAVCCMNWWEARRVLEGGDKIAGMIVELALPEGTPNGVSVALMARSRRERLPVVFTSAHPELLGEVQPGTGPTLSKAVGVQRLIRCVLELIEAPGDRPPKAVPHLAPPPRLSLAPTARYRLDSATRFRSVNDNALVLWGKSRTQLLGRPLLEVFPQIDGEPKFRAHLDVLAGHSPYAGRLLSVILHDQIDIHIARDRAGLQVRFSLAA